MVDEASSVQVISRYGVLKTVLNPVEEIGNLVYAWQVKSLVAISPGGQKLLVRKKCFIMTFFKKNI